MTGAGDEDHRILVVTTTVGSEAAASELARGLLERRLAACVQIDAQVKSLYRWRGELCEDLEVRLVIKSVPDREGALQAFMAEHHPYELPQFVAIAVPASAGYARWVRDEVGAAGPAGAAGMPAGAPPARS